MQVDTFILFHGKKCAANEQGLKHTKGNLFCQLFVAVEGRAHVEKSRKFY